MLSLSMIVRDEEQQLGACLESVKGFCDELVVVDTGSTDNTIAIAKEAGARVEEIEWPGDFTPARNKALELVSGDWVLVLDADEQLLDSVKPALQALMAQPDVLVINLLRYEDGAVQSPYSSVSRLFRKHPAIQWSRAYHSMIDDSVEELLKSESQWRVVDCAEPALFHTGYRPEQLIAGNKANRLREAMEAELASKPVTPMPAPSSAVWRWIKATPPAASPCWRWGWSTARAINTASAMSCCCTWASPTAAADDPRSPERYYREALEEPLAPRSGGSPAQPGRPAAAAEQAGRSHRGDGGCDPATAGGDVGLVQPRPDPTQSRRHRRGDRGLPERFTAGSQQPRAAPKPGSCPAGRRQL